MTTRLRSLLLLLTLLFAVGIVGVVTTAQQKSAQSKSAKSKSAAPMPVLPPLPKTGTLKPASGDASFTFIVAGDNRPATQTPTPSAITGQLIKDMKQYQPSFILWTGDVIAGKDPVHKEIKAEYEAFLKLVHHAGVPVFDVPGNHEMNAAKNAPCPKMGALYQKHMVKELYGAFAYGNSRFVAVNTDSLKKNANCKPPTSSKKYDNKGYVNRDQLASLDAYLKANADAQYIFIFMHRPMLPKSGGVGLDEASTTKLEKIFAKYTNIAYVLAAHEHLYYNALTKDNSPPPCLPSNATTPFYLVSGGAGAPLSGDKEAEEEEKGEFDPDAFYNYLVFEVTANTVKATLVDCGKDEKKAKCQAQPSCAPIP
jgi:hypothetical protein